MFKEYIHVERLGKEETDGLLNGKCYITAKIDGTNSSVFWDDGISAGSRNRKLSYEEDNAGFYSWLMSDNEEAILLRKMVEENHNIHVFGEFGVGKVGFIKYYLSEAKEYLWLFDVYDDDMSRYLNWKEMVELFEKYCLDKWIVQLLGVYDNPTMEDLEDCIGRNNFLIVNDELGEGIVIKNYDYKDKYGKYQIGKIVRKEYKQRKVKKKDYIDNIELEIVNRYLTESELSKNVSKTETYFGVEFSNENKYIGYFLNICWKESILEEVSDWCKKYNYPVVDMRKLYSITKCVALKFIGLG